MCRSDSSKGIFRRKASSASIRSGSRLAPPSSTSQSCPTSPRYNSRSQKGKVVHESSEASTSSNSRRSSSAKIGSSSSSAALVGMDSSCGGGESSSKNGSLHRSASAISNFKQGQTNNPGGFCSYTGKILLNSFFLQIYNNFYLLGSAPTSVHGSRVDLTNPANNTGSAIYLGFSPGGRSHYMSSSSWSVSKVSTTSGSAPPTPVHTPPVSPLHGSRK